MLPMNFTFEYGIASIAVIVISFVGFCLGVHLFRREKTGERWLEFVLSLTSLIVCVTYIIDGAVVEYAHDILVLLYSCTILGVLLFLYAEQRYPVKRIQQEKEIVESMIEIQKQIEIEADKEEKERES